MEEEKTTSETQKSDSCPDHSQLNAFENFYEKFRKVPLKYIDVFIGVCVAALGIKGFWNFSHYDLSVPYPEVVVENVHLGDSLMSLGYRLRNQEK